MIQESLARKFKPAGFEQPEGSRHEYTKPRKELQDAFDEWLGGLPEYERHVCWQNEIERLQKIIPPFGKIPYMEANALLIDFKPKNEGEKCAGVFITACYSQAPESVITFDLDAPEVDLIGYMFGEGKALINNGVTGEHFAELSSGVVINNGKHADTMSKTFRFGKDWIFIDFQRPIVVRHGDYLYKEDFDKNPELKKYFEEVSEISRNVADEESAKRFMEKYGVRGELIAPQVRAILKEEGGSDT